MRYSVVLIQHTVLHIQFCTIKASTALNAHFILQRRRYENFSRPLFDLFSLERDRSSGYTRPLPITADSDDIR